MTTRFLLSSAAACLPALATLTAQADATPPAAPALRADDALWARIETPASLGDALQATNVGDALGEALDDTLRAALADSLLDTLRQIDPGLRATAAALDTALAGTRGTFTLGLEIASEPLPPARPSAIPLAGTLEFRPAAADADLDRLRDTLEGALLASAVRPTTLQLDEVRSLRYLPLAEDAGLSLPRCVGDALRVDFGIPFAAAARARARPGVAWQADEAFGAAPAAVHIDLQRLVPAALVFRRFYGARRWAARELASGLAALDSLQLTARPAGPYLEFGTALRFRPGLPRGAFAGLLPATTTPPRLALLVPDDATVWQAAPVDLPELRRAWCLWLSSLSGPDAAPEELDRHVRRYEEGFEQHWDFQLGPDLLAHCGQHALYASSLGAAEDATATTELVALELTDPHAFAATWPRMLRRFGRSILGPPVQAVRHPDGTLQETERGAWALTNELVVVALGPRARDWCEQVLDRRRGMRRRGGSPSALPAALQRRLPQAPAGVHGCGSLRTDRLLTPWIAVRLFGVDEDLAHALGTAWTRAFAAAGPDLRSRGIEQAVSWSGWDAEEQVWRYRVLW